MTPEWRPNVESLVVMDRSAIAATLRSLAIAIASDNADRLDELALLGILRRGRPLADRIARHIAHFTGIQPPVGSLATTLYRDDVRSGAMPEFKGETHFDFSVENRTIVLVDDVLAAGRTIRAAMDEVMDYGRPRRIQLACLIDRGGRELPIQADYLGYPISTARDEWVFVRLDEVDGEDMVLVQRLPDSPDACGDSHFGGGALP